MQLLTERLLLRDFVESDWEAVQGYAADPEAVRYRPFGPCTDDGTRAVVYELARQPELPGRRMYDLAIVRRADGELIGGYDFGRMTDDPTEAGIGYILIRSCWGQGYVTEASRAVLSYCFEQLGVERVSADVDPENAASVRVLQKLGMRCVAQEKEWLKGRECDNHLYVIHADEWRAKQG